MRTTVRPRNAHSSFHYQPIDPVQQEIRLLTIVPDDFHETVQCRLSKASLKEGIFDALSYVWGGDPSTSSHTILLDGLHFPVTPNLHSALQGLRLAKGSIPQPLWVDAVCINQKDITERNWQVAMMGDIYASANHVIIWLGEADKDSDAAFDAIPLLATGKRLYRYEDHKNEADFEQQCAMIERCSAFFSGLLNQRPWFSRVWILQELSLAKNDPLVVCGSRRAPWSTLVRVWRAIARNLFTELGFVRSKDGGDGSESCDSDLRSEDEEGVEILAKIKIDVLNDLRRATQKRGGNSLRQLLLISRTSEATDPRDRVYSLLGLLKHSGIAILADYYKPCAAVYADATSHIFSTGEGPYFLSGVFLPGISAEAPYIPSLPSNIDQPLLPSWVPDFSRQTAELANQPLGILFHPPAGSSASGAGSSCMNGKVLDDSQTLQVEGLVIDTVDHVVPAAQDFDQCISQLPTLEAMVADAKERPEQFDASVAPFIRQFKTKDPLWKILVSNKRYLSGYDVAPAAYEDMHLHLLNQVASSTITTDQDSRDAEQSEYALCLQQTFKKRTVFTTVSGFCGTCVPDTREGDIVVILFGSPVPFVMRPVLLAVEEKVGFERPIHSLVGGAYVGGIMDGEMVNELYCEDLMDSTTFFLQ
jgi:hypothetical protein